MGELRSYVAGLAEERIGPPRGDLDQGLIPDDFVDLVGQTLRGSGNRGTDSPFLDEELVRLEETIRGNALESRGHYAQKAKWPDGAPFAACLTHDVDSIDRPFKHIIERRSRFSTTDLVLAALRLRSLYNNLEYIARMEDEKGLRSSFYFLAGAYDLKALAGRLDSLRHGGWEIGLHGDFGTHDSGEKMAEASTNFAESLGFRPSGVREHYLQFDFGKTWLIMQDAGFVYDSTVGNRSELGFRVGLSTPFHPPSEDWEMMKILEIPLALMDTTLWGYLREDEEKGMADVKAMAEKVARVGGLFTLLWHQEAARMKGGRLYPTILDHLKEMGAHFLTGAEVVSWWSGRSQPLERDGDSYRFPGKPPAGLCLELELKEGLKAQVKGGSIVRKGSKTLVKVEQEGFELKVA